MLNNVSIVLLIGVLITTISCKKEKTNEEETSVSVNLEGPNILLIIADDMGLDVSPCYDYNQNLPDMPTLESLCADGLVFENVWVAPECTPTRATIITGKYGYRTGVLGVTENNKINTSEESIQDLLKQHSTYNYSCGMFGKWHLSGGGTNASSAPNDMGLDHYEGYFGGAMSDYFSWTKVENGSVGSSNTYATTDFTDAAIDWIDKQSGPWFTWLAYTAPHAPFHVPPSNLHNRNLVDDEATINANATPYFFAMMEAMDAEMGRLLASLSEAERENTLIIFIGDNGNTRQVTQSPFVGGKTKSTLYQGGINTPLIVSGYGVTRKGEREDALVNSTDLFSTIAEATGMNVSKQDSKSFWELLSNQHAAKRDWVYAEIKSSPNDSWTARNETYKLIQSSDGTEELYDLKKDPYENSELIGVGLDLEATLNYNALKDTISQIRQ